MHTIYLLLSTTIYYYLLLSWNNQSSSHKLGNSQFIVVTKRELPGKNHVRGSTPKICAVIIQLYRCTRRKRPSQSAVVSNARSSPNHTSKVHTAGPIRHFRRTNEKEIRGREENSNRKAEKSARSAIRKIKPGVPSYHHRIYEKGKEEEERRQAEKEENSCPLSICRDFTVHSSPLLVLFRVESIGQSSTHSGTNHFGALWAHPGTFTFAMLHEGLRRG